MVPFFRAQSFSFRLISDMGIDFVCGFTLRVTSFFDFAALGILKVVDFQLNGRQAEGHRFFRLGPLRHRVRTALGQAR